MNEHAAPTWEDIFGDDEQDGDDVSLESALKANSPDFWRKRNLVHKMVTVEGDDHTSGYTYRQYPRSRYEMLKLWSKAL